MVVVLFEVVFVVALGVLVVVLDIEFSFFPVFGLFRALAFLVFRVVWFAVGLCAWEV